MEKCQFASESHDGVIWARARSHCTEKLCNVNLTTIFRSWHSRSTFGCSLESRLSDARAEGGTEASYFQIFREIHFLGIFHLLDIPPRCLQRRQFHLITSRKNKQNCIKIPWPGGVGRLWVSASSSFLTSKDIFPRRMNEKRKWKLSRALGRARRSFHY